MGKCPDYRRDSDFRNVRGKLADEAGNINSI